MPKRPVEKRFDVCYSITGEVAAFSVDISACVAWLGGEFSQLDVCRKGPCGDILPAIVHVRSRPVTATHQRGSV